MQYKTNSCHFTCPSPSIEHILQFQQQLVHNLHQALLPKFRIPQLSRHLLQSLNPRTLLKRITRHIIVTTGSKQVIAGLLSLRIPHHSSHPFHRRRFRPWSNLQPVLRRSFSFVAIVIEAKVGADL